jgi:hypothetical protein
MYSKKRSLFSVFLILLFTLFIFCSKDSTNPLEEEKNYNTITVTNRFIIGDFTWSLSLYFDGTLRKSELEYGSTYTLRDLSDGEYSIRFTAAPSEGAGYEEIDWSNTVTVQGGVTYDLELTPLGIVEAD